MRRGLLIGGALLALSSSLAMAQPESLLPDIFDDPAPQPAPTPTPTARPQAPAAGSRTPAAPAAGNTASPVVQSLPSAGSSAGEGAAPSSISLPANFPSLAELEEMDDSEINDLLGLRPKFDVPPAARRAMLRVGVIAADEGGFPSRSLVAQPAPLVRAALEAMRGPLVSRWGHILLRRALASRLDAPGGMDPAEFAALRATALNNIGEGQVARSLVQDVDGSNYTIALTNAAFDAYLATGDLLGMCPVARLHPDHRDDGSWILTQAICDAYLGEGRSAERRLQRALGTGEAPEIDVRLAQRFAGAAGDAGRAVNIEWDGVDELTPWRYSLARSLGVDLPEDLRSAASTNYDLSDAVIPAIALATRVQAANRAGARGVLSSAAMVDLYSQIYGSDSATPEERSVSASLREAYVAADPAARLTALRGMWDANGGYGRYVLTAYAAARLPASNALADDAGDLIASMLTAGLDGNAMRWASVVDEGSQGWALLALANPGRGMVDGGALGKFIGDDGSEDSRKSRFLLAGLAGLGRLDNADVAEYAGDLGVDFNRSTPWSTRIDQAAQVGNPALVALLAGIGMQGTGWENMTARHLYHIVSALNAVGLDAEARMIAAEAVARG